MTFSHGININMSVGMSVMSKMRRWNGVAYAHAQSHFRAVKNLPVIPVLLISTTRQSSFSMDKKETFT